ncbi:MAG: hypothetical protein IPO05_17450 [Flavobacteriales bacterium]|nr:hypothetical protein [Flavobacteriales bacterium]
MLVPNRFQGLAMGIRLDNAGTAVSTATVVRAEFENNSTAVRADKMTSVDIRACSFSNTQPGITTSTALGQGITSANSTLTVRPGCPNGADECPGQTLVRNTFTNLDHGIELFDTGFGSYATIFQNDFTNNIAGICQAPKALWSDIPATSMTWCTVTKLLVWRGPISAKGSVRMCSRRTMPN